MLLQKGDSNSNVKCLQQGLRIVCINPKGTDGILAMEQKVLLKDFKLNMVLQIQELLMT